jgi:hypothetical protein
LESQRRLPAKRIQTGASGATRCAGTLEIKVENGILAAAATIRLIEAAFRLPLSFA